MKLDPVDQKALKGSLKSAKDKDINNDGKVNSSDEYLHKRRQAVSKALGKLKEETLDEKKLSDKDVKRALASAKAQAKPKETVSLKKPPFKMDEEAEELDEANQVKMSNLKVGDTVKLSKRFGGKQGIVHKVHKDGADIAYGANSPAFTHQSNFTKINVAKEEVNKDFIVKAIKPTVTDDTSIKTIADIKPLRMKLAHFRHHE